MPKPKHVDLSNLSPEEIANIPVIQGLPPEPEDIALEKAIFELAAEIAERVNAGTLALTQSKVIGDVLFVSTGDDYYVIDPQSDDIQKSDSAELQVERWSYEGLVENLECLKNDLELWLREA